MKEVFHVKQFFRFLFFEFEQGNARDFGHHEADFFRPDHGFVLFLVLFPITFGLFQQFAKALFFFPVFHGFFKIL